MTVEAYRRSYCAAWREFISALPKGVTPSEGPDDAVVVLVVAQAEKGRPTLPEDARAALKKGFRALGLDFGAVRTIPARRAYRGTGDVSVDLGGWARLLAWEVELIDPCAVLVAGDEALEVARAAWPGCAAPGTFGRPIHRLPDLRWALSSPAGKRSLWAALKRAAPAVLLDA